MAKKEPEGAQAIPLISGLTVQTTSLDPDSTCNASTFPSSPPMARMGSRGCQARPKVFVVFELRCTIRCSLVAVNQTDTSEDSLSAHPVAAIKAPSEDHATLKVSWGALSKVMCGVISGVMDSTVYGGVR